jgi:hypothetical protein
MTAGLVLFLACEIVTIPEGLKGFANEGVLTVMALFIVAEGLSRTGALDYYLGMLVRPRRRRQRSRQRQRSFSPRLVRICEMSTRKLNPMPFFLSVAAQLGTPKTIPGAQIRLMVPIATLRYDVMIAPAASSMYSINH